MKEKDYTIEQHIHNYAIWTAARAVQRNFTTTENIKNAIEVTDLESFSQSKKKITFDEYDSLHSLWGNILIEQLKNTSCAYGQAAKIIAIYLKTSVILCNRANNSMSAIIHPPIDGILLRNLSIIKGLEDLKKIRWTKMVEHDYWQLLYKLRSVFGSADWRLESHWQPA